MMYKKVLCNGSGNTFFLIHRDDFKAINIDTKTIRMLCGYGQKSNIDGLLLISSLSNNGYLLDYYNCDGTWETLCVNGSLCTARYMSNHFIDSDNIIFMAGDGTHTARVNKKMISVSMPPPVELKKNIIISGFSGSLIDSGARHFCTIVENCTSDIVTTFGPIIRNDAIFKPEGTNVNFIELIDEKFIKVFTYEKGVEKFMTSCGSGSVASIYYAYSLLAVGYNGLPKIKSPCKIITPGGEFFVTFDDKKSWLDTYVSGPTVISSVEKIKSLKQ